MPRFITRIILSCLALLCSVGLASAQDSSDAVKEAQRLTRVAQGAQQQGRYDDAIKAYQTIAVVAKGSPGVAAAAVLNAGNIYMTERKYDQAADSFRRSFALNANSAAAQNNL